MITKTKINIFDKLFTVTLKPYFESHILVNNDLCIQCKNKDCTKLCPTYVFNLSENEEKIILNYENCIECGACPSICPYESIKYQDPKDGYGI